MLCPLIDEIAGNWSHIVFQAGSIQMYCYLLDSLNWKSIPIIYDLCIDWLMANFRALTCRMFTVDRMNCLLVYW